MKYNALIRKPAVAGTFYPKSPEELKAQLKTFFDAGGKIELPSKPFGIIAPHAGYVYSGETAARAYKLIKGEKYSTVVVISPSHREYFEGSSIYSGEAYETPLGQIPIDSEMCERIASNGKHVYKSINGHRQEHALEVQLPFLQIALTDFTLIPIVIGDQNPKYVYDLADALIKSIDNSVLLIASSDLSHFHNKKTANKLDSVIENHIVSFDYQRLLSDLSIGACEACGGGPIAALMKTAEAFKKNKAVALRRCDSGDVTGDSDEVVGYLSAVIYG